MPKVRTTPIAAAGSTLVILPTYNERPNLEALVLAIRGEDCDVLVVDDNSPTAPGELADRLAGSDPGVLVEHRPEAGAGDRPHRRLKRGRELGYALLVTMDADGSPSARHLARPGGGSAYYMAVFVIGSRYVSGGSIVAGTRAASSSPIPQPVRRTILGIRVHDCTFGISLLPTAAVIERVDLDRIICGRLRLPHRAAVPAASRPASRSPRSPSASRIGSPERRRCRARRSPRPSSSLPRLRWLEGGARGREVVRRRSRGRADGSTARSPGRAETVP